VVQTKAVIVALRLNRLSILLCMIEYTEDVANRIDRQNIFKIPLRKAIVLFSVLLFIIIALSSSIAYYFSIQKVLNENLTQELKQTLDSRRYRLKAELENEILLLKVLSEGPSLKNYFLDPSNEKVKKESFAIFAHYKKFFQDTILAWASKKDLNYYVNGQFMEKYDFSNPKYSWFFETLEYKNPPLIKTDFDYLNRYTYDLYINHPVYSEGEAIGVICGRIPLFKFISNLRLPENIFLFDNNGTILGSADVHIAKKKMNIKELFGSQGEEIDKRAQMMKRNSTIDFSIDNTQYVMIRAEKFDLFLIIKDEINTKKILKERTSIVFFTLLLLMALAFAVFNIFMLHILKPMNKNMQSYIESSLLDELTKIPNRRFFNMRMEDEWHRAIREKYPISFLMLDLDKFKKYNDTYGHLEGDILLREAARIFSNCLSRSSDFVARFGGEEFCVVLANTKIEGAKKIAENIRASVEKAGKITVSIGLVCEIPKAGNHYKNFMDTADQKLYEAKNNGRNKVVG
jgi:diguanylate cyclase (GGDEF)-like protein